jgi:hypothetical protein
MTCLGSIWDHPTCPMICWCSTRSCQEAIDFTDAQDEGKIHT